MAVALGLLAPASASAGQLKVGAAVVDASWHVGASAGQYASDGSFVDENGSFDPTGESTRRKSSYGIESRLQTRAIAIDGPKPGDSDLFAIVKNDNYIPQDLVYRRAGQILQERGVLSRGPEQLTMAVTHDHSSPMYSSTSWGVWTFQDVFDVRFYDYLAERMADAVQKAVQNLKPAKVGAAVGQFDKTHRHSFGPAMADDGTPAGYPNSDADHDMTVVRFDGLDGTPIATLFNYSLHGEFLDGNDLISADWPGALQAMADKQTKAVTIVTQNAVGTAEPERSTYHSIHERLEFTHDEYRQVEYGARLMTDELVKLWNQVGDGVPGTVADADRFVPFRSDFADDGHEVAQMDRWFPGPITHPYPQVSNCRTDAAAAGDPRLPVIGLPDCNTLDQGLGNLSDLVGGPDPPDILPAPIDPGLTTDDFERAGVPVPENYGAPGYTGLEEDIDVHLQAFRIGDILFTVCSCEQWKDQAKNIKTRTDRTPNNEYLGWDWKQFCTQNNDGTYGSAPDGYGTGTWKCPDPNDPDPTHPTHFLPDLPDQKVERMHRQVVNPANGWNNPSYVPYADSEPTNLTQIKGNYTHDDACKQPLPPLEYGQAENDTWDKPCALGEQSPSAQLGYKLTVPISMANDYNGYIATYREFQRGDAYRKALTGWGPHSSDYMASRLVDMGRVLNGGDASKLLPDEVLQSKVTADVALNDQRAQKVGTGGTTATTAYEQGLPNDGGSPQAVTQPPDIERFDGTFFTWNGGSNYTDNPDVKVQRKVGGSWQDYDGQSGELPVTIKYPQGPDAASYETGSFEWHWTAHFEAFVSGTGKLPFKPVEGNDATPAGVYRFVVDGHRREGGQVKPYHVLSKEFVVKPWSGVTVNDMSLDSGRKVSFQVGPRSTRTSGTLHSEIGPIDYPDTYDYEGRGPLPPFITKNIRPIRDPAAPNDASKIEWFCDECSFRPWLDAADADKAKVTFVDASGHAQQVSATEQAGRWVTTAALPAGGTAVVAPGCVQDAYGDFNGKESARLGSNAAAAAGCAVEAPTADDRGGGGGSGGGKPLGKALGRLLGQGGCAKPTGSVHGKVLGRVRLGATRGAERSRFPSFSARRAGVDRFCLRGGGHIRIGYLSQVGRALFSRRRRSGDRAVLILTTSRHYAARGIRHGSSVRSLKLRFRHLRSVRIGRNRWYLARGRVARLVFKVHAGRVEEVGIASLRLTRGARRAKRFLRSFPG